MAQDFVGQIFAADLCQRDGSTDVRDTAQRLPVICIQIGSGTGFWQCMAERFARQHAVQRFVHESRTAQMFCSSFRLAAAHQCTRCPVMRCGCQLDIHCSGCGAAESIGRTGAITKTPSGKAMDPVALGNPRAGTFGNGLRHRHGGRIVVLDIVAPGHALAPFGPGCAGKRGVDAVEDLARAVGIVVLDLFEDRGAYAARHAAILHAARLQALGSIGLGDKSLLARQVGRRHEATLQAQIADPLCLG